MGLFAGVHDILAHKLHTEKREINYYYWPNIKITVDNDKQ